MFTFYQHATTPVLKNSLKSTSRRLYNCTGSRYQSFQITIPNPLPNFEEAYMKYWELDYTLAQLFIHKSTDNQYGPWRYWSICWEHASWTLEETWRINYISLNSHTTIATSHQSKWRQTNNCTETKMLISNPLGRNMRKTTPKPRSCLQNS